MCYSCFLPGHKGGHPHTEPQCSTQGTGVLPSHSSTALHPHPHSRSLTVHSDPYANTWQNVAPVYILYRWGGGLFKLVSKALSCIRGQSGSHGDS